MKRRNWRSVVREKVAKESLDDLEMSRSAFPDLISRLERKYNARVTVINKPYLSRDEIYAVVQPQVSPKTSLMYVWKNGDWERAD